MKRLVITGRVPVQSPHLAFQNVLMTNNKLSGPTASMIYTLWPETQLRRKCPTIGGVTFSASISSRSPCNLCSHRLYYKSSGVTLYAIP